MQTFFGLIFTDLDRFLWWLHAGLLDDKLAHYINNIYWEPLSTLYRILKVLERLRSKSMLA